MQTRSFHGRHGRISKSREAVRRDLLAQREISLRGVVDLRAELGKETAIIDFGCGMGDHTLALAHCGIGVLAVDVHTAGILDVVAAAESQNLPHVLVHLGDGLNDLPSVLVAGSVDEVHVLFPDPWPKAKHHKRRLVRPWFLDQVANWLRPGGKLLLVTDIANYAEHALRVIGGDLRFTPVDAPEWTPTRYHAKALREGRTPVAFAWHYGN